MELNLIILTLLYLVCIFSYRKFKNKLSSFNVVTIILIVLFISIIILVYPLISEEDIFKRIVLSILYSIQCIYVGQDIDLIRNNIVLNSFSGLYIGFLYACFLLAPVLTTGFVLSLLENFFQIIHLQFHFLLPFSDEIYVFSNLNRESILLAEKMKTKKKIIIFCNVKDEVIKESIKNRCKKLNAILTKDSELDIIITKKKIQFLEISNDEVYNTDQTLKLIEKFSDRENVKVVDFTRRYEAELMLDSVERKIEVEIINKDKYSVYNLLNERPLIKFAKDRVSSVLLFGSEERVLLLIKTLLWSMQIVGYSININVVGLNADHIKKRFYHDCPGLKEDKYEVYFYNVDVQTEDFDILVENSFKNINYIILAEESDDLNIKTGIFLREFYLYLDKENYSNTPPIHLWLNEDIKGLDLLGINESTYSVSHVKNRKLEYDLYGFGSTEQIYKEISILNNNFPKFALFCHLSNMDRLVSPYEKQIRHITTFKNREKTRAYSMGAVLHMKNLLYSKGIDIYDGITKEKIEKLREILKDEENHKCFEYSDLMFWNVYSRAGGFRKNTFEEAKIYKENGISRNQQHPLAKLNPCLVEPEDFPRIEDELEVFMGKRINLIQVEKDYVDNCPTVLEYVLEDKDLEKN